MRISKPLLQYVFYILSCLLIIIGIAGCGESTSKNLPLPIISEQFVSYYTPSEPSTTMTRAELLPEYQQQIRHFSQQETTVPIKGEHFGSNKVTTDMTYFEAAHFSIDDHLYKIIIYQRIGESDTSLLNIQLNSYSKNGELIDALLLDSRFSFEEFQRFSEFTIEQHTINIDNYVAYLYEIVNGGDIGQKIEHPVAQIYITERYKMEQGHFQILSREEKKIESE